MKNYMVNDMADEMTQHEYSNNRYYAPLHFLYIYMWGSKIWARDLGPGTTFHQQYARGEEITEDRCN